MKSFLRTGYLLLAALWLGRSPVYTQENIFFRTPSLQEYARELDHLPADRPESLKTAIGRYKSLFENTSPHIADSAYVLLEDFAVINTRAVEFNRILLHAGNNDRSVAEKRTAAEYEKILAASYFTVVRENGAITVTPDLFRIQKELKPFLHPRTYAYFSAVQQENMESKGSVETLSPKELAERTLFWEEFLAEPTSFLFRNEAEQRRDLYLEQLIFGSESHPVFRSDKTIDPAYRTAYEYIAKNGNRTDATASKTYSTVQAFLRLLQANRYRESPEIWLFTF